MLSKKWAFLALIVFVVPMLFTACEGETKEVQVVVTKIVQETIVEKETVVQTEKETIIEEKEVVVTQIVEVEVPVEVVVEPEEEAPAAIVAPNPDTYTFVSFGDPDTLDINLNYETSGGQVILNVSEGLIFYNFNDSTTYVPQLATEVPTVENGGISADGMTYVFKIREGVTFHNGNDLTPSDFAYTFHRGFIQSDPNGPQWLLLEPVLGYASGDVTEELADGEYAGDPAALVENIAAEDLVAVCEKIKAAVVADDDAGTLTFNLAMPWGPFLSTLAQGWGYAMDKEWAIENGAWDGSCDNWTDYYAPGSENSELTEIINGTGPYCSFT